MSVHGSATAATVGSAMGNNEAMHFQDVVCAFIVAQPGDVDAADEQKEEAGASSSPLRLLCTLRPATAEHFPGLYEFPGGKVDAGESHVEALCRECKEELGVDVCIVSHDGEMRVDEGSSAAVLTSHSSAQTTRPCYAFHHAPRPDKRLGGHVIFRLWFYWAYIASDDDSVTNEAEHGKEGATSIGQAATRRRPQPQPLASDGIYWMTPKDMTQRTFCPGDEGIISALADGTLRPPAKARISS